MRRPALLGLLVGLVVCGTAGGRTTVDSGITGSVVAGPVCPVARIPPQPGCGPRPLAATLRIRRIAAATREFEVRSGVNGHFRVRLAPGRYVVRGLAHGASGLPRPPAPLRVQVRAHRFTAVTIEYDTGIR